MVNWASPRSFSVSPRSVYARSPSRPRADWRKDRQVVVGGPPSSKRVTHVPALLHTWKMAGSAWQPRAEAETTEHVGTCRGSSVTAYFEKCVFTSYHANSALVLPQRYPGYLLSVGKGSPRVHGWTHALPGANQLLLKLRIYQLQCLQILMKPKFRWSFVPTLGFRIYVFTKSCMECYVTTGYNIEMAPFAREGATLTGALYKT